MMNIEKGIKMPRRTCTRHDLDFLDNMEVGDSLLPVALGYSEISASQFVGTCNRWSQRNKNGEWRFSQRTTPEGVRVWRVK